MSEMGREEKGGYGENKETEGERGKVAWNKGQKRMRKFRRRKQKEDMQVTRDKFNGKTRTRRVRRK